MAKFFLSLIRKYVRCVIIIFICVIIKAFWQWKNLNVHFPEHVQILLLSFVTLLGNNQHDTDLQKASKMAEL